MLMSNINELAINNSTINEQYVRKYGTFKLQSEKNVTENGKVTADCGFNGFSSVNVNVESGGSETMWYAWVNQDNENDIYYCDTETPINGSTRAYSNSGSQIIVDNYIDGNIIITEITYVRNSDYDTPNLMQKLSINIYDILNNTHFNTETPFIGYENVEFDKIPTFTIFSKYSGASYFPTYICVKSEDINNDNFNYESMIYQINNLPTDEVTWAVYGDNAMIVRHGATYDSSTNQITIKSDIEGTGEEWIAVYDNVNKYSSILYNEDCIFY